MWITSKLRQFHRTLLLRSAMRNLRRGNIEKSVIEDLWRGWGNTGWSADTTYLATIARAARDTRGNIVECGSGASTILLGSIAPQRTYSLEHIREWRDKVQSYTSSRVLHAPLRSYGDFDWYTVPEDLPGDITLVICDGPPAQTRGGRYGLLPVIGKRLAPDATILVDDAGRSGEQDVIARWSREFSVSSKMDPAGFATVQVAPANQPK